jgi:hypothetical protein
MYDTLTYHANAISNSKKLFLCLTGLKMIIGVDFCGCQAAKVTIYSEDEIGVKRRRWGYFQLEKTVFFS